MLLLWNGIVLPAKWLKSAIRDSCNLQIDRPIVTYLRRYSHSLNDVKIDSRNLLNAFGLSSVFSQFDRINAFRRKYSSLRIDKRSNCWAIWTHWKWKWIRSDSSEVKPMSKLRDWKAQWHHTLWPLVRPTKNL